MTVLRLLAIQPDGAVPPARLGEWLAEAGVDIEVRDPAVDPIPEDCSDYAGLVCLGGAMGVHEVERYPWLLAVQRLLARATTDEVPVLAICLGAQLLAAAHGGEVSGSNGSEVGPGLVSKRDAAWSDPLLAELPLLPDVLQFHRDSIDRLPADAQLLASAPAVENQAFRIGRCAYGLQFHIEATPEIVLDWAGRSPELADRARPGALSEDVLISTHEDIAEVWQPVATNFAGLVSGEIQPVESRGRTLPLR